MCWWWHILADFSESIKNFAEKTAILIWNLQSWGECATINVLHLNLLFYTEHKFRVDGRFCDLVLEMFKADLH